MRWGLFLEAGGRLSLALVLTSVGSHMAGAERPPIAAGTSQAIPADSPFVALFDGTLNGWTVQNSSAGNFSIREGILRVEGPSGWLRSAREYRDFVLRTELRFLTADADSGVFIRAVGTGTFMRGWPGDSYQVQVRVPTAPGPLPPIGGLFRHGTPQGDTALDTEAVRKAFTGMGAWQRLELEVERDTLVVRLNGVETTRAGNIMPRAGAIGIQGETGALEYRSIEIRER